MADSDLKRFSYTARDAQGKVVSGTVSADSQTAAAKRLQNMSLAPLSLRAATGKGSGAGLSTSLKLPERRKKVKAKHIAVFARQFATMIEAGLPLIRSLNALANQTDHPEMARVLPLVRNDVEGGTAFSLALSRHPSVFPPLMIGMVAAGEVSGSLGEAMNQVADNYDKEAKLRSKVVSALTYPVIVLVMAFLMVAFMMMFVIPRFAEVFKQLGGELPLPTQILMTLSSLSIYIFPALVVAFVAFSFWWRRHKSDRKVRNIVDPLKLKIPILGKFQNKIIMARFSRTLSSLLGSGVPVIQSLEIVASTVGSIVVSDALMEVRNAVRAGKPIYSTIEQFSVFPPLVVQMVSTGEETGQVPTMLTKVAEYYETEVEAASENLSAALEPILLIFLAVIVGSMIIALYLPMFTVYQNIGK